MGQASRSDDRHRHPIPARRSRHHQREARRRFVLVPIALAYGRAHPTRCCECKKGAARLLVRSWLTLRLTTLTTGAWVRVSRVCPIDHAEGGGRRRGGGDHLEIRIAGPYASSVESVSSRLVAFRISNTALDKQTFAFLPSTTSQTLTRMLKNVHAMIRLVALAAPVAVNAQGHFSYGRYGATWAVRPPRSSLRLRCLPTQAPSKPTGAWPTCATLESLYLCRGSRRVRPWSAWPETCALTRAARANMWTWLRRHEALGLIHERIYGMPACP